MSLATFIEEFTTKASAMEREYKAKEDAITIEMAWLKEATINQRNLKNQIMSEYSKLEEVHNAIKEEKLKLVEEKNILDVQITILEEENKTIKEEKMKLEEENKKIQEAKDKLEENKSLTEANKKFEDECKQVTEEVRKMMANDDKVIKTLKAECDSWKKKMTEMRDWANIYLATGPMSTVDPVLMETPNPAPAQAQSLVQPKPGDLADLGAVDLTALDVNALLDSIQLPSPMAPDAVLAPRKRTWVTQSAFVTEDVSAASSPSNANEEEEEESDDILVTSLVPKRRRV
jgi:hypothetical protein